MITAEFGSAALARIRLAPSPVCESIKLLLLALDPTPFPMFAIDARAARECLLDPDVRLLAELLAAGRTARYLPDFLLPAPPPGDPDLATGLDAVAGADGAAVVADLDEVGRLGGVIGAGVRRAAERGALAERAAAGLDRFFARVVAARWPSLLGMLRADIEHRARLATTGGIAAVFGSLHESIGWADGRLRIRSGFEESLRVEDADVVLVPSAGSWPGVAVQLCHPGAGLLVYPARLAGRPAADPAEPAADLLGSGRAAVLQAVRTPRCTRELSGIVRLSESTTSHHLQILQRSGLVSRSRDGRRVLYSLTAHGAALVGA